MDLNSVADELYGLPPGDFTATRNARAKAARADGNRELSQRIADLEKPTTSAWLVNQLAREHADELEPLIALGQGLREATTNISGDELRRLTRQRHQVVSALVQQARRLGAAAGVKVSDTVAGEVQQTLDASLADPGAADAVLSGRLTHALEYAGFGSAGGAAPVPARRAGTAATRRKKTDTGAAKVADLTERRRTAAQRALDEAQQTLDRAEDDQEAAVEASDQAAAEHRAADDEVERLRTELERAGEAARAAAKAARAADQRAERGAQAVRKAEQARNEAAQHLAELSR